MLTPCECKVLDRLPLMVAEADCASELRLRVEVEGGESHAVLDPRNRALGLK
jgi:hypothetical protein